MRLFSVIAALAVGAGIYFLVIDREAGRSLLGQVASEENTEVAAETMVADAVRSDRVRVLVKKFKAQAIDTAVVLRGQTRAAREVDVKSETSAIVISEPLRKGQFVEAGQELCRLEIGARGAALEQARAQLDEARARAPEAEAVLEQSQALLKEAEINQNASSRLNDSGFASTTRVANAEANVATALAAVESARAGLRAAQSGIEAAESTVASAEREIEQLSIKAPFSGLLESDTAELGALLQPGALCASVIQLDPIKLVAFVPETEVDRVKVGALAGARLATGQREVSGKVTFLSRSADETTRTFLVEIEVDNADLAISDGQTAEILIQGEGAKAHLIPQSALTLNDDGVLGVRAVETDSLVAFYPVRVLRDTADGIWLDGLPENVDVIILGQEYVIAGVEVDAHYGEFGQ